MKFISIATAFALTALVASAAPSGDGTFALVERDTPTCWLDDKIGGTCNWKCEQRGASSGSCKTGTCVCSGAKTRRSLDEVFDLGKRDAQVHHMQKRWSCQVGAIGGKGLSNALCSASCADATGGKKDGYCNSE